MPCNLAVSITKCTVPEAQRALLTPSIVASALRAFFAAQGLAATEIQGTADVRFVVVVHEVTVSVFEGQVNVTTPTWPTAQQRSYARDLSRNLAILLPRLADEALVSTVQAVLAARGGAVVRQDVSVQDGDAIVPAMVITLTQ